MFVYCRVCGFIINEKSKNPKCKVCEADMIPVPDEYLTSSGFMFSSPEKRKEFEESIKCTEMFDEHINADMERILKEKESIHNEEVARKVEAYNESRPKFTCPVCHSENLSKISNLGKFVKVSAIGILGAGDIGKKYKCNSCGYRF